MSNFRNPHQEAKHLRRIKRAMKKSDLTGLELAALMGRPNQVISELFTLRTNITIETAVQLHKALGVDVKKILREQLDFQVEQFRQTNGDWI